MRDLDAGILGSSRDTASAPRGRTEIELSQSTASVEPDREPSRSAHVPNRCAAGLQDVRIGDMHIDGALNDGASGVAGDGRPEACTRHEVRAIRASSGGSRMREMTFALGPMPSRTTADLLGSKDSVSHIDGALDDGATGVAGDGRSEAY